MCFKNVPNNKPKLLPKVSVWHFPLKATAQKLTYGQCIICFCQMVLRFFFFLNTLQTNTSETNWPIQEKKCHTKLQRNFYVFQNSKGIIIFGIHNSTK